MSVISGLALSFLLVLQMLLLLLKEAEAGTHAFPLNSP